MRFFDWFAGVGGIRLGLEAAGHECVGACEVDPFARKVYEHRFGHAPLGDIRDVTAGQLPQADLWAGGFPCQDVSTAGKRAGIEEGTRSGLVWKLLDLAAAVRPQWLLLENVPGLLSVDSGRGLGALLARLEDVGYVGAWRVLDAQGFGVPQRRRRVFLLAERGARAGRCREILALPKGVRGNSAPSRCKGADESCHSSAHAFSSCSPTGSGGFGFGCDVSPTVRGTNVPAVTVAGGSPRRLTPRECERIQGMPDDWTALEGAPDSKRYKATGNSVAVPVLAWIGRRLATHITTTKPRRSTL